MRPAEIHWRAAGIALHQELIGIKVSGACVLLTFCRDMFARCMLHRPDLFTLIVSPARRNIYLYEDLLVSQDVTTLSLINKDQHLQKVITIESEDTFL